MKEKTESYRRTPLQQWCTWISLAITAATAFYVAFMYQQLPQVVPMHFNFSGEIDGWGGKGSVWFLPAISLFMWVLLFILSDRPELHNYYYLREENKTAQYRFSCSLLAVTNLFISVVFALLSLDVMNRALGDVYPLLFQSIIIVVILGILAMIAALVSLRRFKPKKQ